VNWFSPGITIFRICNMGFIPTLPQVGYYIPRSSFDQQFAIYIGALMRFSKRILYSFSFLAIFSIILSGCSLSQSSRYLLQVNVVNMVENSPVTGARVRAQLLDKDGNPKGLSHIQSLDENGQSSFRLSPGRYKVSMVTGYSGFEIVDLDKDIEITLKVSQIYSY
jgi:hypothetical protein